MATVANTEQRASTEVKTDPLATALIPEIIEERRREADGTISRTVLNKYVRGRLLGKVSRWH